MIKHFYSSFKCLETISSEPFLCFSLVQATIISCLITAIALLTSLLPPLFSYNLFSSFKNIILAAVLRQTMSFFRSKLPMFLPILPQNKRESPYKAYKASLNIAPYFSGLTSYTLTSSLPNPGPSTSGPLHMKFTLIGNTFPQMVAWLRQGLFFTLSF